MFSRMSTGQCASPKQEALTARHKVPVIWGLFCLFVCLFALLFLAVMPDYVAKAGLDFVTLLLQPPK